MNAQAQMSGQLPGRVPNQSNQQMAGLPNQKGFALPPQMQSLAVHSIDRDLENHRERVRNSLVHLLQKRTNDPTADWVHKIPEFAKRLEDELYKYAHSKEDYMNMNTATMEQRLQGIVKNLPINGRPLPHHTPSSSLTNTMIPAPGMQHNANTSTVIACSADNPMITSGGSGVVQNPLSSGNLLPTVNGAPAVGHNPPFSASDGKKIHCPAQTDEITEVLAAFKKSYAEMKSLADRSDAHACKLLDEVERLKKELEEAKAAGAELAATLESQLQAKDAEIATITVDANSSLVDIVFKTRGQVMKDIKEGKYTQQHINDIAIDYDNLMAEEEDDDEGVTIDDAEGADGRSQGIPPNETPLVDGKETDVESDPGAAA